MPKLKANTTPKTKTLKRNLKRWLRRRGYEAYDENIWIKAAKDIAGNREVHVHFYPDCYEFRGLVRLCGCVDIRTLCKAPYTMNPLEAIDKRIGRDNYVARNPSPLTIENADCIEIIPDDCLG